MIKSLLRIVFVLFAIFLSGCKAQNGRITFPLHEYLLNGGVNCSTFNETSEGGDTSYGSADNSGRIGFQASAKVNVPLTENLSVRFCQQRFIN